MLGTQKAQTDCLLSFDCNRCTLQMKNTSTRLRSNTLFVVFVQLWLIYLITHANVISHKDLNIEKYSKKEKWKIQTELTLTRKTWHRLTIQLLGNVISLTVVAWPRRLQDSGQPLSTCSDTDPETWMPTSRIWLHQTVSGTNIHRHMFVMFVFYNFIIDTL